MPSVIINDVEMEARLGERLLNVARRNSAHIGFVCDGNGICQTCQCRVLAGADLLSPPNEAERIWMPERRLASGHRLACQTAIRGEGEVRVITTVEELRRQTLAALRPDDPDYRDNLEALLEHVVRLNVDQLAKYPWNIFATVARVGPARFLWPFRDLERYAGDTTRVSRKMLSGVDRIAAPDANGAAPRPAPPRQFASPEEERIFEAARAVRRAREAARRSE
jgi:ferredoxin